MTYNPGMRMRPKIVPINIPPAEAVPIDLFPRAPAPFDKQRGINPAIKAKEVMRIGLNRAEAPN